MATRNMAVLGRSGVLFSPWTLLSSRHIALLLSFNLLATFFKRDGKAQLKSPEEKEVCFLNN